MARAHGALSQMALAFETIYGTPPASGFMRVPFAPGLTLGSEQPLIENELLGSGRDPLAPVRDAITADGDVVVPIDAETWGLWLKAAFGAPTTTGTGPYTHEFRSGATSLPSMAIEIGMPEVPHFAMVFGCVLDRLQWDIARSELLTATASLIAQGEATATASQAGTLAESPLRRFGNFNGSVSRDGTPLGNVVSASVAYTNNLDRVETIRSDGLIDGADPSIAALTGQIVVRFADTTLLSAAINGTASEITIAYSALGTGETFEIVAHSVFLPRPRIEISGPQGVQVTFDWQAAKDPVLGRMATATLVNDVAVY